MSADPLIGTAAEGQPLNAYSYVENNPLGATDPTGMDCYRIWGANNGGPLYFEGVTCVGNLPGSLPGPYIVLGSLHVPTPFGGGFDQPDYNTGTDHIHSFFRRSAQSDVGQCPRRTNRSRTDQQSLRDIGPDSWMPIQPIFDEYGLPGVRRSRDRHKWNTLGAAWLRRVEGRRRGPCSYDGRGSLFYGGGLRCWWPYRCYWHQ